MKKKGKKENKNLNEIKSESRVEVGNGRKLNFRVFLDAPVSTDMKGWSV